LSAELEELHESVAGIEGDHSTEGMKLSWSVREISDALVDLGVFPIQDIPQHLKSAQDVLMVTDLILERLREERASGTGP
jgi:hypothetical protein